MMVKSPIMLKPVMTSSPSFRIVEIFESLQGEGHNTGMPAIFIRLGRCSLACSWCDTDYLRYQHMSIDDIFQAIATYTAKNIIITGGEPSIHPHLEVLLSALKAKGYFLCIESNALHTISPLIDYIAVSPKYCYEERYEKDCIAQADEVRIVVDIFKIGQPVTTETKESSQYEPPLAPEQIQLAQARFIAWCQHITNKIQAKHYFLSPLEEGGQMNILQTLALIGQLNARNEEEKHAKETIKPHWQLSLQTHKLANIQ
ncbi:7-carboxy-7-deazaguanine synthase QueE [Pelistega ratti]|uniref:7-carboxy-7-deazaguanine synthase QueE n=1 Tax=Pelistega ratti TaxID=2652177 RepID=UPI001FA9F6BE|nr:7-carboxy-7-deazaguanine synthase QueE [Pelistega ratti]